MQRCGGQADRVPRLVRVGQVGEEVVDVAGKRVPGQCISDGLFRSHARSCRISPLGLNGTDTLADASGTRPPVPCGAYSVVSRNSSRPAAVLTAGMPTCSCTWM